MKPLTREILDIINGTSLFRNVLNGEVRHLGAGQCELYVALKPEHRQFLGSAHGGIVGALADDACAWACASMTGSLVTASYTINFLAPASGDALVARGQLVKAGRRVIVGKAEVYDIDGTTERLVSIYQATLAPTEWPKALEIAESLPSGPNPL